MMAMSDRLDLVRDRFQGCNVVALADLTTGMPLSSSTKVKLPQEKIDYLCDTARHFLTGAIAARLPAPPRIAIFVNGRAIEVFVHNPEFGAEVLCCQCSTGIDLPGLTRAAQDLLAELVDKS